jgi:hypothetical protein
MGMPKLNNEVARSIGQSRCRFQDVLETMSYLIPQSAESSITKSRRFVMKVPSSRLIKSAVIAAILVSGVASAGDCGCAQTAATYAAQARDYELSKLSTCDQYAADATAYNSCRSAIYAKAQSQYNYVYSSAYGACSRSCPL